MNIFHNRPSNILLLTRIDGAHDWLPGNSTNLAATERTKTLFQGRNDKRASAPSSHLDEGEEFFHNFKSHVFCLRNFAHRLFFRVLVLSSTTILGASKLRFTPFEDYHSTLQTLCQTCARYLKNVIDYNYKLFDLKCKRPPLLITFVKM